MTPIARYEKYGESLRAPSMLIGRDRRWVVPFLQAASEAHGLFAAELVRKAFCKRFTDREDDTPKATRGARGDHKLKWKRVQVYLNGWMSEQLKAEVKRQQRPASDILLIAFCEVYGEESPELRELYMKWRDVNLVEAA